MAAFDVHFKGTVEVDTVVRVDVNVADDEAAIEAAIELAYERIEAQDSDVAWTTVWETTTLPQNIYIDDYEAGDVERVG